MTGNKLLNTLLSIGLSVVSVAIIQVPARADLVQNIKDMISGGSSDLGRSSQPRRSSTHRDGCPLSTLSPETNASLSLLSFVPAQEDPTIEPGRIESLVEGRTVNEHPRIWFYIPVSSPTGSAFIDFSIYDQDDEYLIRSLKLTLPNSPGIASIQLPSIGHAGLQLGNVYTWTATIKCISPRGNLLPMHDVGGVISLKESGIDSALLPISITYTDYLAQGIWYDMVDHLAINHEEYPQDWAAFLDYFELEGIGSIPVHREPLSQRE